MQKNSVVDALRALATGEKARSETARLRDVFNDVEAALSAGVSRAAILETLHSQGFTMTLKSFESAIYRIRKQREKKGGGLHNTTDAKSATATTEQKKKEDDPLTKPAGFDFKGTRDDNDLF